MRRELLVSAQELSRLKERIACKPFDHIHDTLQRRCALILESQPITETMWRSAFEQGRWGAATAAVASIQGRIFDLCVSHRLDRNAAYRDRAVEELKNLAGFSTWTDPSHKDMIADLCTGEACATVAVALDWLAEEMSEPDRIRCLKALREKGLVPYLKAVQAGAFWHSCYHNWNAVINAGVGLAGLFVGDEETLGQTALVKARAGLRNFFNALGREGGWDEGTGYWGYAMRYVLLLAEALSRTLDDRGLYRQRGMDATGLFPIYFTPHGQAVSFGDRPAVPAWGVFYLLVRHYGLKEACWWLDRYAFRRDVTTAGYSDAGLALVFRPTDWENQPTPDLQPVKVFNEIGWAAVADCWPSPGLYAALKTGDLSAHHAQLDMNSVQLMLNGEVMLSDPGSPDFSREYLSPDGRYGFYQVQSRAHNTLTVAQREHSLDAVGSIVEAQNTPEFRWTAGDAGNALGEDVRFTRHLVMPIQAGAGRMLVVLDEVRNAVPEKITAAWHAAGQVQPAANAKSGCIVGKTARLHFAFAGACALSTGVTREDPPATGDLITVTTPATTDAVLLSVFAPGPIGRVALRRSARGDLVATVGALRLHWKANRHNRQLQGVQEVK